MTNPYLIFTAGIAILGLVFWFAASEIPRRKRNIGTILTALVACLCALAIFPPEKNLKPGIDLAGGSAFTVKIQPTVDEESGEITPVNRNSVTEAIKVIQGRLDSMGMSDLLIQPQGEDRLIIEMTGASEEESDRIERTLEKVAVLKFRKVHPQNTLMVNQLESGQRSGVPGWELKEYEYTNPVTEETTQEKLFLSRRPSLEGSEITQAWADLSRPGVVNLTTTAKGGRRIASETAKMRHGVDRLASVLDGEVISAPVVNGTLGKSFVIEGLDSREEAEELSSQLLNPLKNPLIVEEKRQVSPRLGEATIRQGIYAGVIGLGITFIFMLIYYRLAGIVALIGLTINILVLFGAMAMLGFTFTLPGIAGIVLTIGVAVDANVLIYERLREELSEGKSLGNAIRLAYEKAFSAIIDANITTLLTAAVLFWRASGTVKGFAVTLTLGILASLFAALIVTRVMFWWGTDSGILKKLKFTNLIPEGKHINFMKGRKTAALVSLLLIIVSLLSIGIKRDGALGIDFAGGALIRYQLEEEIPPADLESKLSELSLSKTATVQEESSGDGGLALTVRLAEQDVEAVQSHLAQSFPALTSDSSSVETVGAALGREFLINSAIALGIGLLLILIYITVRFEFSFAIGAFAALIHDVVAVIGLVVLLRGELSLIHVGAILTIAGYSINDTIVVFDRIRETLRLKSGDVLTIINEAINATLSRTILTSLTTLITVTVLFFFGGPPMKDFSFTIIIGIFVGTFSSIFVASPVVAWWAKKRGVDLRKELLDAQLASQVNPARAATGTQGSTLAD